MSKEIGSDSQKLILIHLVLVVFLIAGLSFRQYSNQWGLALSQSAAYHNDLSQRFLAPLSAVISGRNYANISLPTFVNELRNTTSLRYLDIEGVGDDGEIYQIAYLKEIGKPLRAHYPSNYEAQLSAKVRKLEQHIVDKDSDNVKIKFLINRAKDDLKRYQKNAAHSEKITAVLKGIGSSI